MMSDVQRYAVFTVSLGIVVDLSLVLRTREEAVQEALRLIEEQSEQDRYANPARPDYDPRHKELMETLYAERRQSAEELQVFALNEEDDVVFLPVENETTIPHGYDLDCDCPECGMSLEEKLPWNAEEFLEGGLVCPDCGKTVYYQKWSPVFLDVSLEKKDWSW
jgi:hypothetical protein